VGNGASGWILQFTGFDSNLPVQSEHVVLVIRLLLSGIPVIGLVIALIIIRRLRLDEQRMGEIRTELEGRRGTV